MGWRESAEDYLTWLRMSKSPRTAETYYRTVVRLMEFAEVDDPRDLSAAVVTRFLARFSPRWAYTMSYAIRSYLKFCGLQLAEVVPHPRFRAREPHYLREEEVERMVRAARSPRDKAIIWCAYELAMRAGEVIEARREDFDPSRMEMLVRRIKQRGGEPLEKRYPVSDRLATYLRRYLDSRTDTSPYLFVRRHGGRLYRSDLSRMFRRLARAAGIDHPATFHSLRHGRAVELALRWGGDVARLADYLGHRNISSTLLYTSHALYRIGTPPSSSIESTT